jgi:hypothetical protein
VCTLRRVHRAIVLAGGVATGVALVLPLDAASQSPAGTTVFKCETAGQVIYTDTPCTDAHKVDALRIHGGAATAPSAERLPDRAGAARMQSGSIDPWRRVASQTPYAMTRASYGKGVNPECPHLAQRMARVEAEEQTATSRTIGLIQERLAVQRHWYRQLGCAADVPDSASHPTQLSTHRVPGYAG